MNALNEYRLRQFIGVAVALLACGVWILVVLTAYVIVFVDLTPA